MNQISDKSIFPRLRQLFSTDVVIRNIGGNKLRVMDVDRIASYGDLQTNSLVDRFTRLHKGGTNMIYNPTMNYQSLRLQLYSDYEAMDTDPILGTVLDIISEEATLKGESNDVLSIRSNNENIQKILKNLFYDVLNIEFNLPMWIRTMCKYGDFYLHLSIAEKFGVYNVKPLSVYDISREEGQDPNKPNYVRFMWNPVAVAGGTQASKDSRYFENYEIAHFRLLSDPNYLPYGKCLTKNSYIETEFGVKTIDIIREGEKVWTYNIKEDKYELSTVVKQVCSGEKDIIKVSTKNNFIEGSPNHPVLVYSDGEMKYKKMEDLNCRDLVAISDYSFIQKGEQYNINKDLTAEFNKNGWKNNIDNIPEKCDEDFARFLGFMFGDGWITQNRVCFAQGLDYEQNKYYVGKLEEYSGNTVIYNNRIIDNTDIHRQASVGNKMLSTVLQSNGFLGKAITKRIPNWIYEQSDNIQLAFIEGFIEADGTVNVDKWGCFRYTIEIANRELLQDLKILLTRLNIKTGDIIKRKEKNEVYICGIKCNANKSYMMSFYMKGLKKKQTKKYKKEGINNIILEPIIKISRKDKEITYDIQVESENANFIANGIIVHNSYFEPARKIYKQYTLMLDAMLLHRIMRAPEKRIFYVNVGNIPPAEVNGFMQNVVNTMKKTPYIDQQTGDYNLKFNMQNMLEDYYIPLRPGDNTTKIDTAKGLEYAGIDDVVFLRDLMLAAVKVPKAILNYSDELNGKSTISALDVRFSRTIERIQRIILSELYKIALIHLYVQGYEDADMVNFELNLNSPSIIYEQEKIALLKEKVALAGDIMDKKLFSSDWIADRIFNLSEDELNVERELIVHDVERMFRYNQIENEGNDPALSGQSYGTPHDLASIYKANADQGNNEVPDGYNEKDKENVGRPKTKASIYKSDKSWFGRDPLGSKGMKGDPKEKRDMNVKPFAMEAEYLKNKDIIKDLSHFKKKQIVINEVETDNSKLLDEKNIIDEPLT